MYTHSTFMYMLGISLGDNSRLGTGNPHCRMCESTNHVELRGN